MRLIWDPRKAALNARKHRVTFVEAATVFADPLARIVEDAVHVDRALIIGESASQRILVTVSRRTVRTSNKNRQRAAREPRRKKDL